MARIKILDLPEDAKISKEELKKISGGWDLNVGGVGGHLFIPGRPGGPALNFIPGRPGGPAIISSLEDQAVPLSEYQQAGIILK